MSCLPHTVTHTETSLQELIRGGAKKLQNAKSIEALILAGWKIGLSIGKLMIEIEIYRRAQKQKDWPLCVLCSRKLRSKGWEKRQLKAEVGKVKWSRKVGECPNGCRIGLIAPLDEELKLQANQRASKQLERSACALAVFVAYKQCSRLLEIILGVKVHESSIWHWVKKRGAQEQKRVEAELKTMEAGKPIAEEERDEETNKLPFIVGADGVMVAFRNLADKADKKAKTVWREIKLGIIVRFKKAEKEGKNGQLLQRRLVAVLGTADEFKRYLKLEMIKQGVNTAEQVVWISDGSKWLWRIMGELLNGITVIGILDFYHAAQNVGKGLKAWLKASTTAYWCWFRKARKLLKASETDKILAELKVEFEGKRMSKKAKKALTRLFGYLDTHKDHIDYKRFKELGLPIGSGMVESACKWLIQQRFKGVGMRWSDDGFNNLLYLRLAWVNGRFDQIWDTS